MSKIRPDKASEIVDVPFPRVTGLVRQLTHDVRNGLNYRSPGGLSCRRSSPTREAAPEIKRLRGDGHRRREDVAGAVRPFLAGRAALSSPTRRPFSSRISRTRLAKVLPDQAPEIHWTSKLGEEVDLRGYRDALWRAPRVLQERLPVPRGPAADRGPRQRRKGASSWS